jgi:phosphoglycerate dehydrogenase-like enzyme
VAELALALMFALARGLVFHHGGMADGTRTRRVGIELAGRQLGIIGYGAIGRRVAALARSIGMEVVTHDPFVAPDLMAAGGVQAAAWHDVLGSDVVSVHAPYGEATHHLVDRDALATMPPGGLLVNTARPAIVDAAALADDLESGHLGGAAFDDLGPDATVNARLLACDRFIALPHCGATTVDAVVRTGSAAVRAIVEHQSLGTEPR